MMKSSTVALTLIVAVFFSVAHSAGPQDKKRIFDDRLAWTRSTGIASLIHSLPAWDGSPIAADRWEWLMKVAAALQRLAPEDLENALVSYSVLTSSDKYEKDWNVAYTKPFLLLRTMFEIPKEAQLSEQGLPADVGWIISSATNLQSDIPSKWLGIPVGWSDAGPKLVALPAYREFRPQRPYCADVEFRYFANQFEHRDLKRWLKKDVEKWDDLWEQSNRNR